jgi:shikimate kinase
MQLREPLYREIADMITSTDRRRVNAVAELILHEFRTRSNLARSPP